jgi:hypothetical protein
MRREFTYQFVRIERADDYLKCGWLPHAALEGTGHGMWSVLMEWIECPCGKTRTPTIARQPLSPSDSPPGQPQNLSLQTMA